MSKEQFFLMRQEQLVDLYPSDFTKKEATKAGIDFVTQVRESGDFDKVHITTNLVRLQEVINSAMTELRKYLPEEKVVVNGVEFNPVNGGNTVNYTDDPIYNELKADLDARVELLKLAQKQPMIDLYGNDVPKVSTTPRKSSITIKF